MKIFLFLVTQRWHLCTIRVHLITSCIYITDAELNEKMIEQLKAVLHEQEATMETQDTVIGNREEEIASLTKGDISCIVNRDY